MKPRKICVILTTRGNYAKMISVMRAIQDTPGLELQLIVGGGALLPKHGYNLVQRIRNDFPISRTIHFLLEGETPVTMSKSAGLAVTEFTTAFEDLAPDIVIVIADRFECLPIAMAAGYMNIPLAHVEGGEVSGSIDESIRHAITKLAHVHFPATRLAAERIARMGEPLENIHVVGCTSLDIIARLDLDSEEPRRELQGDMGVGSEVDLGKPYVLVVQHPVTTEYSQNSQHIGETIAAIEELCLPTVWIWPNMDAGADGISGGIRTFRETNRPDYVRFYKGLPIQLYAPLLKHSSCLLGNSSSGIRESAFLGVPCVNIGSRQAGRERCANVLDVPYQRTAIAEAVRRQLAHGPYARDCTYGDGRAGKKIVEVLRECHVTIQKRLAY